MVLDLLGRSRSIKTCNFVIFQWYSVENQWILVQILFKTMISIEIFTKTWIFLKNFYGMIPKMFFNEKLTVWASRDVLVPENFFWWKSQFFGVFFVHFLLGHARFGIIFGLALETRHLKVRNVPKICEKMRFSSKFLFPGPTRPLKCKLLIFHLKTFLGSLQKSFSKKINFSTKLNKIYLEIIKNHSKSSPDTEKSWNCMFWSI